MANTWNPLDKGSVYTLSNANRTFTNNTGGLDQIIRGTTAFSGKRYFEVKIVAMTAGNSAVGLAKSSANLNTYLGGDPNAVACYGFGDIQQNATVFASFPYSTGDTVGVHVDTAAGKFWLSKNGSTFNAGGTADPATGVGGFSIGFTAPMFAAASCYTLNDQSIGNFDAANWLFTPKSGFTALDASGSTYTLTAAAGAFVDTRLAANLIVARKLGAVAGAFTETGVAAALRVARKLTAAAGLFTVIGVAATPRADRRLAAVQGAFAQSGAAAILAAGRRIASTAGAFDQTGVPATLRLGRAVIPATGVFSLTGLAATLTKSGPAASYTLTAAPASFSLSGLTVALAAGRQLRIAAGTFAFIGVPAGLVTGRQLIGAAAAYALDGQPASIVAARRLATQAGAFALTGVPVLLTFSAAFVPQTPPERTLAVQGERRVLAVPGENRTLAVQGENRTLRVS